jgi:hypothetical protein
VEPRTMSVLWMSSSYEKVMCLALKFLISGNVTEITYMQKVPDVMGSQLEFFSD